MARISTFWGKLALGMIGLGSAAGAAAQQLNYAKVAVRGFNADVIANGSGAAAASTTHPVDRDRPAARFCFVADDFINSFSQAPTSSLPRGGLIQSASNAGLEFQLEPYDQPNSLRIDSIGRGALHFLAPRPAEIVYLLVCSGNGSSTVDIQVVFTDSTTEAFPNQFIDDWFGGANFAIQGVSRVSRETDNIQNNSFEPRLYQLPLYLSGASQRKAIAYLRFDKQVQPAVFNAMAVAVAAPLTALAADVAGPAQLQVAPNPVTDVLRVQTADATAPVLLLDLTGRTLRRTTAPAGTATLDVAALPAGVYVVRNGISAVRVVKE